MSGWIYWGIVALVIVGVVVGINIWLPKGSKGRRRLKWSLWALAILTHVTAITRILHVWRTAAALGDTTPDGRTGGTPS